MLLWAIWQINQAMLLWEGNYHTKYLWLISHSFDKQVNYKPYNSRVQNYWQHVHRWKFEGKLAKRSIRLEKTIISHPWEPIYIWTHCFSLHLEELIILKRFSWNAWLSCNLQFCLILVSRVFLCSELKKNDKWYSSVEWDQQVSMEKKNPRK